jgi:hypothetical protein
LLLKSERTSSLPNDEGGTFRPHRTSSRSAGPAAVPISGLSHRTTFNQVVLIFSFPFAPLFANSPPSVA